MIYISKITNDTNRRCQSCLETAHYYLYVQSRSSNICIPVCTNCIEELRLNISCNLESENTVKNTESN